MIACIVGVKRNKTEKTQTLIQIRLKIFVYCQKKTLRMVFDRLLRLTSIIHADKERAIASAPEMIDPMFRSFCYN